MKRFLAALALVAALAAQFGLGMAKADLVCEHRSAAHVAEHGGLRADSDWHIAHGQLPTCDDASGESGGSRADEPKNEHHDEDDKSRYCRRHWFC